MRSSLTLAGVALAATVTAVAQQTSDPVSFSGTVMNTATGAPVRFARVELSYQGVATQTDAAGAFQFPRVEPGDYYVQASKTGFTPADGHEGGYEVSLSTSREKFAIWLTPLSSIRGTIQSDAGEPLEGVWVNAMQSWMEAGRRRNHVVSLVETNDRGEYRIPLLRAGKYLIKAAGQFSLKPYYGDNAPTPATPDSFAPVYFGGSPDAAGATVVALQPGAEARADFSVTMLPGHRIQGRITNLKPHRTADLRLSRGDEDLGVNRSSLELVTGQFEIYGVLDGGYQLRVYQQGDGDELPFAERSIVLSGHDVEGVTLTLGAAPGLQGKLRVEGKWDKPTVGFSAVLRAQDSFLALKADQMLRVSGEVTDGKFEIPSVIPGKYWVDFRTGDGLYISSARAGDMDLLATGELVAGPGGATPELDIVLRTDGGGISGTIAAEAGGDPEAGVLLVAESCSRPAAVTAAQPGSGFSFPDVAPGSYRLHAWKDPTEVEFGSPTARCALAQNGTHVEVRAGEVTKVQLQKLSENPK